MSWFIIVYFLDNSVRLIVSIRLEFIACYWEFILIKRLDTRKYATILLFPSSKIDCQFKDFSSATQYLQYLYTKSCIIQGFFLSVFVVSD